MDIDRFKLSAQTNLEMKVQGRLQQKTPKLMGCKDNQQLEHTEALGEKPDESPCGNCDTKHLQACILGIEKLSQEVHQLKEKILLLDRMRHECVPALLAKNSQLGDTHSWQHLLTLSMDFTTNDQQPLTNTAVALAEVKATSLLLTNSWKFGANENRDVQVHYMLETRSHSDYENWSLLSRGQD
ncbi:hypothetical protein Anapl_12440 [Anas platyrhynchos]|uniref:Uncharacterized protein n=1 Tax=Anas platyrhynchos TaxID=8839 RepID=R0KB40_ANAPL|nr:hypothetical protein Anapl_12440 [Anas platyrhynchos]